MYKIFVSPSRSRKNIGNNSKDPTLEKDEFLYIKLEIEVEIEVVYLLR